MFYKYSLQENMKMKKLFILSILLSSHLCVADVSINELLEVQTPVIEKQKFSKHAEKMQTICRKITGDQQYVNVATENQSIKNTPVNQTLLVDSKAATNSKKIIKHSTKTLSNEQIVKKQFENKKREILNTMNELKYKKRDIANKINELTSEIESLQDFALTGEEKKRDFYFSVSGGKTHSSNPNAVVSDMNVITEEIVTIAKIVYENRADNEINAIHIKINPFKNSTIDFQRFGSAALGYHVGGNGKIEFEAINSNMEIAKTSDTKEASLWAIMFNLYYNPTIKNIPFAPYVGIGVGPVNFKFASELKGNVNINLPWFAYQAKLGIAYSFIPELKISIGYRCFNIPVPIADSVTTHNVEVGLIFNF